MLLNIVTCVLFFSDILGSTVGMHPEPEEIISEDTLTRTLRDGGFSEKHFPVHPISQLEDGVTHSINLKTDKKSAYEDAFNDPEWKSQWYMQDYREKLGPVMDMNLVPVYRMGITGKGIYVAIVDTGVEMDHPDLQENLVKELAYTVRGKKGEADPKSILFFKKSDHGTKTAGVIGMTANNSICGVGMAFDAKLIAIKKATLFITDEINAKALSYAKETVDIYTNSWGPPDTGTFMEKIGRQGAMAIDYGTEHGREGKGSLYIFPSGNGYGPADDNCAADELVNYIHTIGIAAATAEGKRSQFCESCTAIYATTYTGGGKHALEYVTTTTLDGQCTNNYIGTSAAAPQASAIIALILQANNKLTYRDVMHLITMGAEVAPLADNDSWYKNGAGFWVSNEFGFGLMNAYNMVNWARKWTNVPEKTMCEFKFNVGEELFFRENQPAVLKQTTDGCQSSTNLQERVFYLEQIILTASVEHRYRGALSITLKSAAGTKSEILTPRRYDSRHKGLNEWNLKSVHNWGEDPNGGWQIEVNALFGKQGLSKVWEIIYQTVIQPLMLRLPDYSETGRVVAMTLWFHGTRDQPDHHKRGKVPRTYSAFRTADGKTSEPLSPKQRTVGGMSSQHLRRSQVS